MNIQTTKAQRIQESLFFANIKNNNIYLGEKTEEFYTQVSIVALTTVVTTLGLIVYSI